MYQWFGFIWLEDDDDLTGVKDTDSKKLSQRDIDIIYNLCMLLRYGIKDTLLLTLWV